MPAADARPGDPAAAPPSPPASMFALVQALLRDLPGLISDRVELAALELHRATRALLQVVALALAAAVLVASAWLGLWFVLAYAAIESGLHWGWAMLIVIGCNLVLAAFAGLRIVALTKVLKMPATMRRMTLAPRSPLAESAAGVQPGSGAAASMPLKEAA